MLNTKNKYYIETLGCPKNEVISEKIAYILTNKLILTKNILEADYIIINSCGFIETALEETIETVIEYKQRFPNKKIVLTGCAVIPYQKEFKKDLKEADIILDYKEFENYFSTNTEIEQNNRISLFDRGYTYLRMSEGCSRHCSYCLIPTIKGPFRKFHINDVLKEAKELESKYDEIILVSQDTLSLGYEYLDKVVSEINKMNFKWIRIMYYNPDSWDDRFLKLFDYEKVVPYIEMPVQHLSKKIAKLMNRKTALEDIKIIIKKIRDYNPDIFIRTTVIVGFPGEKDEDFEILESELVNLGFDFVGIFPYSDGELIPSYKLQDKIDEDEKIERYNVLRNSLDNNASYERIINKKVECIIDYIENERLICRFYGQAPDIDGNVIVEPSKDISAYELGQFITVKIEENILYDFIGKEENL